MTKIDEEKKLKKPHWIEHPHESGENWEYSMYECSDCHEWSDNDSNYCPNCGSNMKGEMIKKNGLKPCPFCGGKMKIISADIRKQDDFRLYHPICTECDCMLSFYDTLEEAIEACNRRG